jgi:hypothetical protein
MSASFHVFKNGSIVAVTNTLSSSKKCNTAHGNPSGTGVIGKFSTKVRTSGPRSGDV